MLCLIYKNIEKQRIETVSNLRLKIYIISPFKKVKEANIVFLVLRTSKE